MNQELQEAFPQRTTEAIKGKRRNPEYKEMVQRYIEELMNPMAPLDPEVEDEELGESGAEFLDFLESLREPRSDDFQEKKLHRIAMEARTSGKEATLQKVALYLREILPYQRRRGGRIMLTPPAPMNKREARRREYGWTQTLWNRDRCRCINNILEQTGKIEQPSRETMEPYWTNLMSTGGNEAPQQEGVATKEGIWGPVHKENLRLARISYNSAPGPDGTTARLYRAIPENVILRLYNLFMWCEALPSEMMLSRTVFLPKKKDAKEPGDFRPITIPPILLRGLHKILARRMEAALNIDARQRAFRSTDGCADNTLLLDTILRYHRREFKSLHMASIDVSKAFDAITHPAIRSTLESLGIPQPMVRYLSGVYAGCKTRLEGDGWTSKAFHPARGVRQGDPLSPIIFNAVTHRLLQKLPNEIGTDLGDTKVNAAAFADDLLLFATTPAGLQELIDTTARFLGECGMTINVNKSMTVSIKASAHLKKTAVDENAIFVCDGRRLPALSRSKEWRYLGVMFTPEGRSKYQPAQIVRPLLNNLTTAPLKPQQRMYALRTMVIPKLYHQLALGSVRIGALNKTDRIVRAAVRRWLALPHDVPVPYFHAAVKDGGLGIPSMRWTAPVSRRGRLLAVLKNTNHPGLIQYIEQELRECEKRLTDQGVCHNNPKIIADRWAQRLYGSVDGAGLKESRSTPHQHQWIADGTRLLTGKDYINCGRTRIGALPTRSRTARGRHQERRCRAGCLAQETLNHVLQHCHRTHESRIRRHNAIVEYVARKMPRNGYTVFKEPHYKTAIGLRKPDLVAVLGETAVIVDAQVVSEQTTLAEAHRRKVQYYSEPAVIEETKRVHAVRTVVVTSATLSWRGVWSADSARELINLGYLKTTELKILATRTLVGNLTAFKKFNATTSVKFRAGIG